MRITTIFQRIIFYTMIFQTSIQSTFRRINQKVPKKSMRFLRIKRESKRLSFTLSFLRFRLVGPNFHKKIQPNHSKKNKILSCKILKLILYSFYINDILFKCYFDVWCCFSSLKWEYFSCGDIFCRHYW